jgi:hypothetical protein
MTLVALGLLLGMVGSLGTMAIEIAQADHQTKRQSSRGEGQTALGDDSSYGFSSQPVRHRRQNVECEEDCFRVSAVFTPFLLLGVYHECGQVEKDIWTTFLCRRLRRGYAHGSHLSGYRSDIFSAVRLAYLGAGATVRGI